MLLSQGSDQYHIYRIIFACDIISGCELIVTDGFFFFTVFGYPEVPGIDILTLYYSTFREFNAAFSKQ